MSNFVWVRLTQRESWYKVSLKEAKRNNISKGQERKIKYWDISTYHKIAKVLHKFWWITKQLVFAESKDQGLL